MVDSSRWIPDQVWKCSTRASMVLCVEMGIVSDACTLLRHTWRNLWGLVRLQVHDAYKIWEAKIMNNWEIWWTWWPAHAPYQMGPSLWRRALTRVGTPTLSYPECHSKELVHWNRALTWYRRMGYLARRIFINILILRTNGWTLLMMHCN